MDQYCASSGTGGIALVIDLGSAQAVNCVAMLNSGLLSSRRRRSSAPSEGDDAGITTNVVTVKNAVSINTALPNHLDRVVTFASTTKRYWQINYSWTGAFNLSLGEIFLGSAVTLTRQKAYGSFGDSESMNAAVVEFSTGDTQCILMSRAIRKKAFAFSDMSSSDLDELMTAWRAGRGGGKPLLWVEQMETGATNPGGTAAQECLLGRLNENGMEWTEVDYGATGLYEPVGLVLTEAAAAAAGCRR